MAVGEPVHQWDSINEVVPLDSIRGAWLHTSASVQNTSTQDTECKSRPGVIGRH
jgi:hypothetical protein